MPRNFTLAILASLVLHIALLAVFVLEWGQEKKHKPLPKHINASLIITPNKKLEQQKLAAKRKAEAEKKRAAQKKAEAQKRAEKKKKLEQQKKREQQKKLEAKRKAEAKKKAEKKKAEAKKKLEQKKKLEAKKKAEAKRKAEAKKRAEKERAEKKKAEEKKKLEQKKKLEAKKKAEAKRKAEEAKRQAEIARQQAEAEQKALEQALLEDTLAAEDAEIQAQEDYFQAQQYSNQIRNSISANWRRPPSARNEMVVVLEIELLPNGDLRKVSVLESSGNEQFDASAVNAVNKTRRFSAIASLESRVFEAYFKRFKLKFSPEDLRQ